VLGTGGTGLGLAVEGKNDYKKIQKSMTNKEASGNK
jgi:hypothetical protein